MKKGLNSKNNRQYKNLFIHLKNSFRRINSQIKFSFKSFTRSKTTIFLFIVFPIIILLLFGTIFVKQKFFTYDLTIQNKDESQIALDLVKKLADNEYLTVKSLSDQNIDPQMYMTQNNVDALLVIPHNWYENSLLNPSSNVILFIDPYKSSSNRVLHIIKKIINEFNLEMKNASALVNLEREIFYSGSMNYIDFFLPGIIGVIIMNIGILGTMIQQANYKKKGLFRKFATTPITRGEYIISEIIWQFLLALTATLITVFIAWVLFSFSWTSLNLMIIPICFIGIILFTGLGLLFSVLIRNSNNSTLLGFVVTIPLLFFSGIFFDVRNIQVFKILSFFSPLTYLVEALRSSMITNNYIAAIINMSIALGIGSVAIIIGAFLTKWAVE